MGMLSDKTPYIVNKGKLLSYLFVFTIFTKGLIVYPDVFNFGIEPYAYIVIPVFFLFLRLTYFELVNISFLAVAIFALNVIVMLSMNYSCLLFLKQFIPIFIFYTATYAFLKKVDIVKIFEIYVKVSVFVCCLGLLQFALYACGFFVYVDVPGRINSIMPEPSHLAIAIFPAMSYFWMTRGVRDWRTLTVLAVLVGTLSVTAYIMLGVFVVLLYFKFNRLNSYVCLAVVFAFAMAAYFASDTVAYRVDDVVAYLTSGSLEQTNLTTFSVFSNLKVAWFSLIRDPFFGAGLGNHESAYLTYFSDVAEFTARESRFGFNMKGGHSLFIRLLSETGLVGFGLVIFCLFRFRVKDRDSVFYAISFSCLMYFVGRVFKLSGYFDYGIYFFAMAYLWSYCSYRSHAAEGRFPQDKLVGPVNAN